jgi:hypothetical protein
LEILQSVKVVKSLFFIMCSFQGNLDIFPPKLKELVHVTIERSCVRVGNLPESLEIFGCLNFQIVGARDFLPAGLIHLEISGLRSANDGTPVTNIPFDLPPKIRRFKLADLPNLQCLPELPMKTLELLEITRCPSLKIIPALPATIQRVKIETCEELENIRFPEHLEELECFNSRELKGDLSSSLRKLVISGLTRLQDHVASLEHFPICL